MSIKKLLVIGLALAVTSVSAKVDNKFGTTLVTRSASDDLSINAHWHGYENKKDHFYSAFWTGYKFQQSFHGNRLAKGILGSDSLHFTGSKVANRNTKTDLLADYFGMATDTDLTLHFRPRIRQHIFHAHLFLGIEEFHPGFYIQIDAPLVHSHWVLRDSAGISTNQPELTPKLSSTPFEPGYMDSVFGTETSKRGINNPDPYTFDANGNRSALAPLRYLFPLTRLRDALQGAEFGALEPWNYGKFVGNDTCKTKLAGLNVDIGINYYQCPTWHLGGYLRCSAPTGTKFDEDHAEFLFSPTIGQDHWKVGAGATFHKQLYNCDDSRMLTLYAQGYLVHMFSKQQMRVFDFNDGILSRYTLMKGFYSSKPSLPGQIGSMATGAMVPGVNFVTRHARVYVPVQGEGSIELVYRHGNGLSAELGYNIYGRAREEMELMTGPDMLMSSRILGKKGDTFLYAAGFPTFVGYSTTDATITERYNEITDPNAAPSPDPTAREWLRHVWDQPLTSTQSNATVHAPGTVDRAIDAHAVMASVLPPLKIVSPNTKPADTFATAEDQSFIYLTGWQTFPVNKELVTDPANNTVIAQLSATGPVLGDVAKGDTLVVDTTSPTGFKQYSTVDDIDWAKSGLNPAIVKNTDIDTYSACSPRQITHKFFGNVSYACPGHKTTPTISLGAEIEIAKAKYTHALNAWAVSITGTLEF